MLPAIWLQFRVSHSLCSQLWIYARTQSQSLTHPKHTCTQYIRSHGTGDFLSKLVIVALSHQEWKSMLLAEWTCCSVEQWNDSGQCVALGLALKGSVNRISSQRYGTRTGFSLPSGCKCELRWQTSWSTSPPFNFSFISPLPMSTSWAVPQLASGFGQHQCCFPQSLW